MSSVNGYVDRVWAEGVAGWSLAPQVLVSVNGTALGSVPCTNRRPDVQAEGLSADGRVGFRAPLALASGDIVRVTTPQGRPLRHSPWLYLSPESEGWLPVSLASRHPEYAEIAVLAGQLALTRFRPLFGQPGQVAAVKLDAGEGPRVACFGVAPRDADHLQHFHERVLTPAGVACPALHHRVGLGKRQALIFDFFPGRPLDRLGPGWEAWLPAVMDELARLQRFGDQHRQRLRARAGRKRPLLNRLLRRAMSDALRWDRARGERRFLLWLLARLARLPRVLSHGDLHRENALVDAERGDIALIDWDRWGYLPTGFDLALLMRGLPGDTAEHLAGGSQAQRLGVVGFTYLFQRLDRPGLVDSEEGRALRRRCRELAGVE
ncbi:aminoglycoside phosphotransferase family protein [Halomonas sp. M4R5S39]|uniref:aminoglycoside phosphotransferase family protein n=1 Tax=Halomonas kalidii TaxID=3043293 RepID=UPI0024A90A63|nr:aminoglycoside phosphotransferase family protein [Halomonas kalidii]MDI5986452.1 aminoglycoside phosphotransferase family protein [Halomonas kalidii]